RLVTCLSRTWNRVEGPDQAPVFRVVGLDAAACTVFTAGESDDHHAVVIKRSRGDRVAVLPVFRLDRPRRFARLLIERHQPAIQLPDIHFAVAQRDAAARPSAADTASGAGSPAPAGPSRPAWLDAARDAVARATGGPAPALRRSRPRRGRVLHSQPGALPVGSPHA